MRTIRGALLLTPGHPKILPVVPAAHVGESWPIVGDRGRPPLTSTLAPVLAEAHGHERRDNGSVRLRRGCRLACAAAVTTGAAAARLLLAAATAAPCCLLRLQCLAPCRPTAAQVLQIQSVGQRHFHLELLGRPVLRDIVPGGNRGGH